jgi:hypothetical protein
MVLSALIAEGAGKEAVPAFQYRALQAQVSKSHRSEREAADNFTSEAAEANLGNTREAVRATGKNQAEEMRTYDADTNFKNGI